MGAVYTAAKTVWRSAVPKGWNRSAFNGRTWVSRRILAAKSVLEKSANHDELYDEKYFLDQEAEMAISGKGIAESLVTHFPFLKTGTLLDVGCGNGAVMAALKTIGVSANGLEYAEAAINRCIDKGLSVHKFDIESDVAYDTPADIVLSTEVAEHLPETCADRYINLMTRLAKRNVVMTAATPGQGGTDHVNEQPNSYWIARLEVRGFRYLQGMTDEFRRDWAARGVDRHRSSNVMVFERAS
ncbi:MAG TPA: methionine biosynthesis protein MetW [Tepidisphaeraceae bacterium]|nr:methionine biosynthesis protein MetW [Tepidisphaeraceae bacterium]